jgi:GNAT superfamily N-acetyltransferase
MSPLSNQTITELNAFWAAETSCRRDDFDRDGIVVAERRATDDSEYMQAFRRKRRLQITCSASLVGVLSQATRRQPLEVVFDPGFFRRALGPRVEQIIGPAYLGYVDAIESACDEPSVRLLTASDDSALGSLRGAVARQDWEYSGLERGQPIAGHFAGGELVSAAGYEVWGGQIAHIGVVTRPEVRGAGYGRGCVRAIARHAIGQGLVAQYRTLYANVGAMAIAKALGFTDYAATIYIVATAT